MPNSDIGDNGLDDSGGIVLPLSWTKRLLPSPPPSSGGGASDSLIHPSPLSKTNRFWGLSTADCDDSRLSTDSTAATRLCFV